MKFTELKKSLDGGIAPVYYLEGEETYFHASAEKMLRERCVQQPTLNDVRIEGDSLKGDALASFRDSLYVYPFLSEKRLVRVYGFYPTEKEYETYLSRYFADPCPTTILLIVNAQKKSGTADWKKKPNVTYVDCSRADEETVCRWIYLTMKRAGVKAEGDAALALAQFCSCSMARISRETEKLILLVGQGGTLTREIVEQNVSRDADYKIYEMTQAASRRSFAAFTEILNDLIEKGFDEIAALGALASHFRTLYDVSAMSGSDAEIGKALGIKPYAVQKNRETAARFGKERVKEFYIRLYELSCASKSGLMTKESALKEAIAKIFFE